MEKKAVVLLSGGIDSTTAMAIARDEGYALYCVTFCYGQRHVREVEFARKSAEVFGAKEHYILNLDLGKLGGSALTEMKDVPKARSWKEIKNEIPVTYVPARNTIFLSYALALAEVKNAPEIFIGVNAIDYSGYPDCRPEFIDAFEKMANKAIKKAVEGKMKISIRTPLLHLTKGEIIRHGVALGVDYGLTHSCYDPSREGKSCGYCDSCLIRKKGFREAGVIDPLDVLQ
jgi:7-cyano-7-deazaguanine synthase